MNVIQVKTDTEQILYIEVSENFNVVNSKRSGGLIAEDEEVAFEMIQKLGEVGITIADVCRSVQQEVITTLMDSKPAELTLEFGLVLASGAGTPLITKSSGEGTFQVTAKWNFTEKK